jgi:exodeoxyribonuclease X
MIVRIFDVETTGLDPKDDRIVEIAAYDLYVDGTIIRVGCDLINPRKPIPPEASAVHHLTDIDVVTAPLFGTVWAERYMPPAGTICAAHNCEFEQEFLPTPAGVQWLCTYKCALRKWPDAPGHSNQVLRYWRKFDDRDGFDCDLARLAHRAEPDTYVTAWLLRDLLSDAPIETLVAWSKEPKVFPVLTFGKHRGEKWAEVPFGYLQWLRDGQHNMDADWRHGARIELDRREPVS